MSHYAKGTNLKSPSNGVGFYKHFPKNVIRPYQGTQELITDEMVNRRVKFYNCEMWKRPLGNVWIGANDKWHHWSSQAT